MRPEEIELLVDTVPIPVMVIGATQTIIAANSAARSLVGEHAIGRHYITALRQPSLLDAIETVARTGMAMQARYLGRDGGHDTTFSVHIGPLGGLQVLTFQDNSATEDAGQMRRDFVANVSHELRTPLTALMGFIETLRGNAKDDAGARERFLSIMEREASRMTRIVEDLLSLSRVEVEERIRPLEQVSLSSIVQSTLMELEPVINASACKVEFDAHDQDHKIPGDAAQLRQVVGNLIENALKYGAKGETVDIRLSVPNHEPALRAKGIRLTVEDYGDGIEEHHIARLTERFYRVDSHRSREIGGTGLGLAIVKHIINRHRGRLQIESAVGAGTKITAILPVN